MSDVTYRELLIRKSSGQHYYLTIPNTATITYGNLHPGGKSGYHHSNNDDKYVLRIYEGTGASKRQTAVFRGVDEFRDLAYNMEKAYPVENDLHQAQQSEPISSVSNIIAAAIPIFEDDEDEF